MMMDLGRVVAQALRDAIGEEERRKAGVPKNAEWLGKAGVEPPERSDSRYSTVYQAIVEERNRQYYRKYGFAYRC